VIAVFRSPNRRIYFAIAFSAMVHAAILLWPHIHLPHEKVQLPPLTARLEPLPLPVAKPAAKPQPPSQLSQPGEGSAAKPIPIVANSMKEMEKSAASHQFPKHLQLTFTVYRGADIFRAGELRQQLDIDKDRYTLNAHKQTGGLSGMMNKEQLIQTSYGKLGAQGLQPEIFKEEKITANGTQNQKATFDWTAQQLHLAHGGDIALPADAQDILSYMFQLSQLSMHREIIPLSISDGTQLEQLQIEVGGTEDLATPLGNLRVLHLRKLHNQNEPYFELWLSLEYRLLPVKFRQIDASDNTIEEYDISDIRAADE